MEFGAHTNGHGPHQRDDESVNPYADAAAGTKPREIVEFEMNTDPYANMLPGISSIRAASTIGRGMRAYRSRGSLVVRILSVVMLLGFLLAIVISVVSQAVH
jgi:hypothetical protein